jgi:site-specific recombinase
MIVVIILAYRRITSAGVGGLVGFGTGDMVALVSGSVSVVVGEMEVNMTGRSIELDSGEIVENLQSVWFEKKSEKLTLYLQLGMSELED